MLVVAALAGYLEKVGSSHRLRALYLGAVAAIVASFVAAWIFAVFNGGEHNDVMEAVVILLAATIMLYVSGWLMIKQDPKSYREYISAKANEALAKDTAWAVGLLAFLAVFREGAETVLFVSALAGTVGGWNLGMFAGLLAGAAGLAVIFFILNRLARRIPLRPLFIVTSVFLFVTAIKFIGDAVQEFQEQTILAVTPIDGFGWLEKIGFNPSGEALSIQLLVALFVVAAFSLVRREQALSHVTRA